MATPIRKPRKVSDAPMRRTLVEKIEQFDQVKTQRKRLADEEVALQLEILDLMHTLEITDDYTAKMGDDSIVSVKIVRGETVSIDENALKKSIGATLWNAITTRHLDKSLLDAHITRGDIKPMTLARASVATPKKPHIRVTKK